MNSPASKKPALFRYWAVRSRRSVRSALSRRARKKLTLMALGLGAVALGTQIFLTNSPYRLALNTTASIARGVYLTKFVPVDEPLEVGQVACFQYWEPQNIKNRGYFAPSATLCKPVLAQQGAHVWQEGEELFFSVAGDTTAIKAATVASKDGKGRAIEPFFSRIPYELGEGQLLLIASAKPNSLDSRFLGPIRREQVTKIAWPLWVENF